MTSINRMWPDIGQLLLFALFTMTEAVRNPEIPTTKHGFIRQQDLPQTGQEWVSFHQTVEFLPATPKIPVLRRKLEDDNEDEDEEEEEEAEEEDTVSNVYSIQPFVEGLSEYDEYQQAWRLLGFMIDCDDLGDLYADDDGNGGSGSWDGGTGQGCQRSVLWAAYVDLEYEGNGISEYMFWDRDAQQWDDRACQYRMNGGGGGGGSGDGGDSDRCAKMDCHLEDTHFSLLGFFKHKVIDDWMEQLFKHEGMCIWTDEEYAFMKGARKGWPQGCSESSTYINDDPSRPIYYDIKPLSSGRITMGLYTDPQCVKEYKSSGFNDQITVENVVGNFLLQEASGSGDNGNYDFSDYSVSDAMSMWEKSFDIFRICHPCVAYDLYNYGYNSDDDAYRGSSYGKYTYGYDDDYSYQYYRGNNQGDDFDCYDDAEYTNVNQCMKFMAKTTMNTATFRDISLASMQGTLVSEPLSGHLDQSSTKAFYIRQGIGTFLTYLFFFCSLFVLFYGILYYRRVKEEVKYTPQINAKEPLVFA